MEFVRPPVFHTDTSSGFRIAVLVALHTVFAIWVKYVVARLPLGTSRILASVPIFLCDVACPWFFDKDTEPLQVFCTIFILSWICIFKVIAFCWGRAPLRESMTVAQMAGSLMLPIFPQPVSRSKAGPEGRLQDSAGSGAQLVARLLVKTGFLTVAVLSYMEYREVMPVVIKHYLLAFITYFMSGILMDGPAALVVGALGLTVLPTFDQPYLSASLAEFWARRWNIPITSVLRTVLYDTIVEGSLINPALRPATKAGGDCAPAAAATATIRVETQQSQPLANGNQKADRLPPPPPPQQQQQQDQQRRPSVWRRFLGLSAVFFVSGVVHEYMAWLLTGSDKLGWKWTFFFWVQAPLLILEGYCSRWMRRVGVVVPRPLGILLTHLVLQALAYDLFFGYMEEQGVSPLVVGAVAKCIRGVLRPLRAAAADLLLLGGFRV